jgi:NitT/TauT family transport system ATP-binding protein/sulfonate transport system ATP-binding protein
MAFYSTAFDRAPNDPPRGAAEAANVESLARGEPGPKPKNSAAKKSARADDFVLAAQDLTVVYSLAGQEPLKVLDGLSVGVRENEFLAILGPGQCGKTTLLNCLAGLIKPTSGRATHRGRPIEGPGPERGLVFQKYALFPWLTVEENVTFGLKSRGAPKAERQTIGQKFIDLVGLAGFEKAYPQALSGGMKQRVGLARAYASGPEALLMDEPFGALDAQTRYAMEKELLAIWEKEKRTVVFVTNNIEEALYLGDRVILLSRRPGRLKKEWPIDLPRPRGYTDPGFLARRREISDLYDLAF